MTYYTYRCPHCKNIIRRTTGYQRSVGNPVCRCPFCGEFYRDNSTNEWVTMHPISRFIYMAEKPFCGAFISFIPVAGFSVMGGLEIGMASIIGAICAIVVFIIWFFVQRIRIKKEINDSLERTKSAKYVSLLKKMGCTIYSIKGVEIGTITDDEGLDDQQLNSQTDCEETYSAVGRE